MITNTNQTSAEEAGEEADDPRAPLSEDSMLPEAEPDEGTAGDMELEALLQTSQEIDELESLLADSLSIRDEAAATKSMRDRLKRGGLPSAERAEIEGKIREWESRREWDALANVAVWERQECQCGQAHDYFSHMMQQQRHKEQRCIRYVTTDKIFLNLPNLVAKQVMTVPMCPACAVSEGFDITKEGMEWQA